MKPESVRALLALMVVGVFMLITAFMAIFPLLMPENFDPAKYSDFFAKTASVYTGIVGVIVGYYFGRAETKASGKTDGEPQEPPSTASGATRLDS